MRRVCLLRVTRRAEDSREVAEYNGLLRTNARMLPMLRTDTAVTIYRKDYAAPAFRID
jgi:hypothetical protein